jgi:hypothetical protein
VLVAVAVVQLLWLVLEATVVVVLAQRLLVQMQPLEQSIQVAVEVASGAERQVRLVALVS